MTQKKNFKPDFERVAQIVADSGGRVVGRTKLQKIAYLLEAAGLGDGFSFAYRHYGPYSEDLASAARSAKLMKIIDEEEHATSWGGFYSIYKVPNSNPGNTLRTQLAKLAEATDAVELELAATAAFLATAGSPDPWEETAKRKPQKASETSLRNAKQFYRQIQKLPTPRTLPSIT